MDATELTNAQYQEFLTANVPTNGQAAECASNATFVPTSKWPAPAGEGSYPVTFVDWCDAVAYCRWAGKRLCGKMGGGDVAYSASADPTKSEWFNACSAGGTLAYPYGNSYQGAACNGFDNGVGRTVEVGSKAACEGGYPGLFDLSGNVWEWEDSCDGTSGANDGCRIRGAAFTGLGNGRCDDVSVAAKRADSAANIGLRCCAAATNGA